MTFLKKLGQVIANIAGIVTGVGPIFSAAVPKAGSTIAVITTDLQQIAGVIQTVEAIGAAATTAIPGAEKLRMATPLVAQAILQSTLLAGKHIANETLYKQGAQKVADGMADILNSLHDNGVSVTQPQDVK